MVQMCCGDATNVAQRQPCLMHPYGQTSAVVGGHGQSASRRQASEVLGEHTPPSHRGRRESRMLVAPAASCAVKKAHELETTGSTGATRPSLRNG